MAVTMTTWGMLDGRNPTIPSTTISNASVATCGVRVADLVRVPIDHSSATPATNAPSAASGRQNATMSGSTTPMPMSTRLPVIASANT